MNRRRFLEISGSASVALLIAQLPWKSAAAYEEEDNAIDTALSIFEFPVVPEFVKLNELKPNDEANLVNAVVVPETLLVRTNKEKVKMAVDFRTTFNKDNPDVLRNNIWGYGESVKDAIRRGQEVWLVLDIPDTTDQVGLEELARYFSAVAKEYSMHDVKRAHKTARFVIGNELNAFAKTRSESYLQWYAKVYVRAVLAMRKVSSRIQLFPYADAYYGSGKTLDTALTLIKQESASMEFSDALIDIRDEPMSGLCFHYYDDKTGIRERAELYRQLAENNNIPSNLHLLELGKPEQSPATFTTSDHQYVIARNLAESLVLRAEGVLETIFWHTAESVDDVRGHALFIHKGGRFEPKPQFLTYSIMSKLLHHAVTWKEEFIEDTSSRVTITGLTSAEDIARVIWIRTKNASGQILTESPPEVKVYPASKVSISRFLRSSLSGIVELGG